jgi:hypothetical protein
LPVTERAELILSAPADLQTVLINSFGTSGKLRELMDLQLMQMQGDKQTFGRIEKQRISHQRRLASRIRHLLSASDSAQSAAELVIESWLSDNEKGHHAKAA